MTGLFNRRALLLGGAAAGGTLMLRDEPFSPVICGPGSIISSALAQPVTPRVRPSLATPEGKKMLALYGKAIGRMKDLPRHDPRNWYFQANIHGYPEGRPVSGTRSPVMQRILDSLPAEERTRWIFSPDRGRTSQERTQITRNRALALGPPGQHGVWHSCSHFHLHFMSADQAGAEDHFLSWHRMYLHFFEQIAMSVLDPNDPPFALPYWDYTHQDQNREFDQRRMPAQFAEVKLPDGSDNHLFYQHRNERFLQNGLNEPTVNPSSLFRMEELLSTSGSDFSNEIKDGIHGNIHGAIGPAMGMGSFEFAGRDPLFWIHHASIDRLWESWRRPNRDGQSDLDPPSSDWRNVSFSFADPSSQLVPMRVDDALVLSAANRTVYDRLEELGAPSAATSETRRTGPLTTLAQTRQQTAPQITELDAPVAVQVPAPSRGDIVAGLRGQANARYFLVIDVEATTVPGGVYEVFARVPSANGTKEQLVATFNMFGPIADGNRTKTWRSDITNLVRQKLIDPEKPVDLVFRAAYAKPTTPVTIKRVRIRAL